MPKNGTWVSYGGGGAIMLAAALAAIAVAIGYAGLRLPRPARFPRARRPARIAARRHLAAGIPRAPGVRAPVRAARG